MNIIRRDDVTINVTASQSGTPIDITGYSVYFTVKERLNQPDSEALISKKVTSHTNPTQGVTRVVLSQTDTDIDEGDYYYDFQLITGGGVVSSTQRDTFSVADDVTIRTS